MALSDIKIRTAKPLAKPYKLADGGGLYIEIAVNSSKYWRYKYRFEGKEKRISLGVYPDVTLAEARERHQDARKLLAKGIDPSQHRKDSKAHKKVNSANSFEFVAREWWQNYMKGNAESHKNKVIRRFELYLFPWIGNKPISEITSPQLINTINRIEKLNKLETAHRTLQAAGQVFRYGVQNGYNIRDITADLRGALPPTQVKHMATITEPKQIGELLRAIDGFTGTFTVQCALKLSPLVFVRPGELRRAKWQDIDLHAGEWRYMVSKTKTDHIVPLSKQAIEILKSIQPLSGNGEYWTSPVLIDIS